MRKSGGVTQALINRSCAPAACSLHVHCNKNVSLVSTCIDLLEEIPALDSSLD